MELNVLLTADRNVHLSSTKLESICSFINYSNEEQCAYCEVDNTVVYVVDHNNIVVDEFDCYRNGFETILDYLNRNAKNITYVNFDLQKFMKDNEE